jgi:glyceraldehyde-3-phosphate dehydrogenase (NAD(P))
MKKLRIGVLGYGVIGRRAADAVAAQDDMEIIGVAGRPSSFSLRDAAARGLPVFVTEPPVSGDPARRFCEIQGTLPDMARQCDAILDCTPAGVAGSHRSGFDGQPPPVVIYQGGEDHSLSGVSFNSFANYPEASGRARIRVISCSSTGTTRFAFAMDQAFGLREAFVALVRRSADPGKRSKVPVNALLPHMGQSHHAADVNTVLPGLRLYSMSVDANTTFGHIIRVQADLERGATREEVIEVLNSMPRVNVGSGLGSTSDVATQYADLGRSRRDRPEIYVWEECLDVRGGTVRAAFSVHMESITIPETVDCLRSAFNLETDNWTSIEKTDRALGIAKDRACYERWRRMSQLNPAPTRHANRDPQPALA